MTSPQIDSESFRRSVGDLPIFGPGTDEYDALSSPDNSSVHQTPAIVVRPRSAGEVSAAVSAAAEAGALIAVQSTGHGAGRTIGHETVLIHTGALTRISIDWRARTATVGAGAVWGDVQAAAESHGLLGLSGSSPRVGVAGYTFGGGVGWLTRPHGLASGALRSVNYVDGAGTIRRAGEDAANPVDRTALWAFRGGAPPGVAVDLTFDLFQVEELWAGYLLWPERHFDRLADAWSTALPELSDSVTSSVALVHLPPQGPFPAQLLGTTVVALSYASLGGQKGLQPLRDALCAVSLPVVDTTGPCDAARLGTIHLDPPGAEPTLGTGLWLRDDGPSIAGSAFNAGQVGKPGGLLMVEMRHVAVGHVTGMGAMTSPPGPFVVHAVGAAGTIEQSAQTRAGLLRVEAAVADVGLRAALPFLDGSPSPKDGYGTTVVSRLDSLADALDPERVFRFERSPVTAG